MISLAFLALLVLPGEAAPFCTVRRADLPRNNHGVTFAWIETDTADAQGGVTLRDSVTVTFENLTDFFAVQSVYCTFGREGERGAALLVGTTHGQDDRQLVLLPPAVNNTTNSWHTIHLPPTKATFGAGSAVLFSHADETLAYYTDYDTVVSVADGDDGLLRIVVPTATPATSGDNASTVSANVTHIAPPSGAIRGGYPGGVAVDAALSEPDVVFWSGSGFLAALDALTGETISVLVESAVGQDDGFVEDDDGGWNVPGSRVDARSALYGGKLSVYDGLAVIFHYQTFIFYDVSDPKHMKVLGEHSVDEDPEVWAGEWPQLQGRYLYYNAPNCAYSAYCFIGLAIASIDVDELRDDPENVEGWFEVIGHIDDGIGTSVDRPPLALFGDEVLVGPSAVLLDVSDRAEPVAVACATEGEAELPIPDCDNAGGGYAGVAAQRCGERPDCAARAAADLGRATPNLWYATMLLLFLLHHVE